MGKGDEYVGEDDGGVGVDRRHTMMAPAAFRCHRERGGDVVPLVFPPPWPPPGWGEVLPLVLGLHGDDGPSRILLHGLWCRMPERA